MKPEARERQKLMREARKAFRVRMNMVQLNHIANAAVESALRATVLDRMDKLNTCGTMAEFFADVRPKPPKQ